MTGKIVSVQNLHGKFALRFGKGVKYIAHLPYCFHKGSLQPATLRENKMNNDDIFVDPLANSNPNMICVIKLLMVIALRLGIILPSQQRPFYFTHCRADGPYCWTGCSVFVTYDYEKVLFVIKLMLGSHVRGQRCSTFQVIGKSL